MNALEKKKQEYAAKIREVGSRVRFHLLDVESAEVSSEQDTLAKELVDAYSEQEMADALSFAKYLGQSATSDCEACKGVGALKISKCRCARFVNLTGPFVHTETCLKDLAVETYEPCECGRQNETKRKAAARESAATVRVKSTREADLDKRIVEAERMLKDAIARQTQAVDPTVEEIEKLSADLVTYEKVRSRFVQEVHLQDQKARDHQKVVDDLRESLREAESRLKESITCRERSEEILAAYVADVYLIEKMAELQATRDRIAGHHEPKIEKAQRLLKRLKYLRGEKTAEEVTVKFGSTP